MYAFTIVDDLYCTNSDNYTVQSQTIDSVLFDLIYYYIRFILYKVRRLTSHYYKQKYATHKDPLNYTVQSQTIDIDW